MTRIAQFFLFFIFCMSVPALAAEKVAVIVNKANTNAVDRATIEKIYQAKKLRWTVGGEILTLDLPGFNPVTSQFYSRTVGRSHAETREIWSLKTFTGMGTPPQVVKSDDEMKKVVAENKNAIGYIKASNVDSSVKVVYMGE